MTNPLPTPVRNGLVYQLPLKKGIGGLTPAMKQKSSLIQILKSAPRVLTSDRT